MAKKKGKSVSKKKPAAEVGEVKATPGGVGVVDAGWPDIFPSRKTVMGLGVLVFLVTLLLFYHSAFNNLLWLRRVAGYFVGISNPELLPAGAGSFSIGMVIWAVFMMVVGGAIHPSVGLAVFVILRPCLDGNTFPEVNFYFIWGALFILVLWGVRLLLRGGELRFWRPILLFAGLLMVAVVTSAGAVNFNVAYRSLLLWFTYFVLFVLASNSLRDRLSLRIVLGAVAVSVGAQALYAILGYHFLFPYLRGLLADETNAKMIAQMFGPDDSLSPLAMHRYQSNRAFGNLLFPNALAGFLILSIPFQLVGSICGWRGLFAARRAGSVEAVEKKPDASSRRTATFVGGMSWLATVTVAYFVFEFTVAYTGEPPAVQAAARKFYFFLALGLGLIPAVYFFLMTLRQGLLRVGQTLRAGGFTVFLVLSVWALWLTYSRGGMLALFFASFVGMALLWVEPRHVPAFLRKKLFPVAAGVVLLFVVAGLLGAPPLETGAHAQDITAGGTMEDVMPDGVGGIDVTMADMLRTSTFRLRWSYWMAGWDMYKDYIWTGVGLGCFGQTYAAHQYVGAGPVTEAHNGYLQFFCETGLFGGVLFIAFWVYFVCWGARRILREEDKQERLILVGLYTGILAFVLHAVIDMNFSIVTISMFVMVMTGAFYARSQLNDTAQSTGAGTSSLRIPSQIVAAALLVLAALVMGLSTRAYALDFALSRGAFLQSAARDEINLRRDTGVFLMKGVFDELAENPKKRPYLPVGHVMALIPEREKLEEFGAIYVAQPEGGARRVAKEELIPPNALFFISIPAKGAALGRLGAEAWLAEFERIDGGFPHSPENAYEIAVYYRFLAELVDPEKDLTLRKQYLHEYARWAGEAVRRAPVAAAFHIVYAQALLAMGNVVDTANQMDYFQQSVEQYRLASQSAAYRPEYWFKYGDALRDLSGAYTTWGNTERAEALKVKMRDAYGRGDILVQQYVAFGEL